jgi:tetratricopeptide (TPR) repeat protein
VVAYSPLLTAGFVLDDVFLIEKNSLVSEWASLWNLWIRPYWSGSLADNSLVYRPLVTLSFVLSALIAGKAPWFFHLTNLFLYALIWLGLSLTLRPKWNLGEKKSIALAVAWFWAALHPLQSEVVAAIAYRTDLMVSLFWVAGLWVTLHLRGARRDGLLGLCTLGAIFSKETGVLLPLSWWVLRVGTEAADALHSSGRGQKQRSLSLRKIVLSGPIFRLSAIFVGALLFAVFVRRGVLGAWLSGSEIPALDNPLVTLHGWERWSLALKVLGKNFISVLWPWPLSPDYSFAELMDLSSLWLLPGVLGLGILSAWLYQALRKLPTVGAALEASGVLLALISLLFTSNLFFLISNIRAERFLHLPILGLLVAVTGRLHRLMGHPGKKELLIKSQEAHQSTVSIDRMIPIGLMILIFAPLTFLRAGAWRSEYHLFSDAVKVVPKSARAHLNLGNALFKLDRMLECEQEYQIAVKLYPEFVLAWTNLAVVQSRLGKLKEARTSVKNALTYNPHFGPALQAQEFLKNAGAGPD